MRYEEPIIYTEKSMGQKRRNDGSDWGGHVVKDLKGFHHHGAQGWKEGDCYVRIRSGWFSSYCL